MRPGVRRMSEQEDGEVDQLPTACPDCGKTLETRGDVMVHALAVTGDDDHKGGFEF